MYDLGQIFQTQKCRARSEKEVQAPEAKVRDEGRKKEGNQIKFNNYNVN